MLGLSSRFFKAGYKVPKYMLPLWGGTVFEHVIKSFYRYYDTDKFILIIRSDFYDIEFLEDTLRKLGVSNWKIKIHEGETLGQADSVRYALNGEFSDEELFIFNIDTILYDFKKELLINKAGYLEVFQGIGSHWSFVKPSNLVPGQAEQVVEKQRISSLCSNGLYNFSSLDLYINLFEYYIKNEWDKNSELYVAPIYQTAINLNRIVSYKKVDVSHIGFCGTPDEYEELAASQIEKRN
jgi:hypothetical protein